MSNLPVPYTNVNHECTGRRPTFGVKRSRKAQESSDSDSDEDEEDEAEQLPTHTRSSKQVITRGSKQKRPETHARDMVWNMQTGKYEPAPDPIQFASTNPSYALVRGKVQQLVSELSDAVKDTTLEDLLDEERSSKKSSNRARICWIRTQGFPYQCLHTCSVSPTHFPRMSLENSRFTTSWPM